MSAPPFDLTELYARRSALEAELADAQATLDGARAGLVAGTSTARQVVTAQTLCDALEGALASLGARISDREQAAADARAATHRQALLDTLVSGAQRATSHSQAARVALEAALADIAPKLSAAFGELYDLHDLREGWVRTLKEFDRLQPVPGSALSVLEASADLRDVRAKPLPGSWHHGISNSPNSSAISGLPAELFILWQLYAELQRQAKVPHRRLTGVGQ